jgi:hypothetical protein
MPLSIMHGRCLHQMTWNIEKLVVSCNHDCKLSDRDLV